MSARMIYKNSRTMRVRFLQILFWFVTLGALVMSLVDYLGGAPDAWMAGAILLPIFGLCAVGMEYYLRHYVTALEARAEGLSVETLSTFGRNRKTYVWPDVALGKDRHDLFVAPDVPVVNNTYTMLRLKGFRFPLIIDTTEDAFDAGAMKRPGR